MKCGKCKKDGVTNEHVRDCYGLRPRQTSNATLDIDREIDAANEARAQAARRKAETKRKQEAETKRKNALNREAARRAFDLQKSFEGQRVASRCKACDRFPDIQGRCGCS